MAGGGGVFIFVVGINYILPFVKNHVLLQYCRLNRCIIKSNMLRAKFCFHNK